MITGFNKPVRTLFIDPQTAVEPVAPKELCDIILSPSFYWVKRIVLPVKTVREVNRVLPSLFEDTVPEGKYSYYAYSDEDAYLVFAYDDKKILDYLAGYKIKPEQLRNVYFAQSEFQDISDAVAIGDDFVLDVEDRVVVKLPKSLVSTDNPLDLAGHTFSDHGISLARYAHIATTKSMFRFALFTGALIMIFTLDWIVSSIKAKEFDAVHTALYVEHGLPPTRVQNEAILDKLQKRYDSQLEMRRIAGAVLNLKMKKGEFIRMLELQNDMLHVEIALASEQRAKTLSKSLADQRITFKEQFKNGILRLEIGL